MVRARQTYRFLDDKLLSTRRTQPRPTQLSKTTQRLFSYHAAEKSKQNLRIRKLAHMYKRNNVNEIRTHSDEEDCVGCGSLKDSANMLLCDGKGVDGANCPNACHTYCCVPPLLSVPEGEWFCYKCDKGGVDVCCQSKQEHEDTERATAKHERKADRAQRRERKAQRAQIRKYRERIRAALYKYRF